MNQYVAVLTYAFDPNKPVGMPDEWPWQVQDLGNSVTLPSSDWLLMTRAEFTEYQNTHRAAWQAWKDTVVLAEAKKAKIQKFEAETFEYIQRFVALPSQISYLAILMFAMAESKNNRFLYVSQVWGWAMQIAGYNMAKIQEVMAATSLEALHAIEWNLELADPGYPNVTLDGALAITD